MHPEQPTVAADAALEHFVDALPKAELHIHLEGSVAPRTLLDLARRHATTTIPGDLDALADFYRFRDFEHFVEVYYAICDNLRSAEDFALIVRQLGATLAAQGVVWAEVTVTPFNHTRRGVAVEEVFEGIESGRLSAEADHGIRLRWSTDVPGEFGPEAAIATARMVTTHRPEGVISFGLGGPEQGVPRPQFAEAFAIARDAGLHSVPHAGETTGAQSVRDSLDHLGAERIGHGIHCLEDPDLVARLRDEAIPLEVCPTSNVRLGQATSLETHPIRRLIDSGLVVTLNSDDPPMFNTTLRDEHLAVVRRCGVSAAELAELVRAGIRSSFMPEADKGPLLAQIDAVPLPD